VIHSVNANIGHVHALFISLFEGRMISRWIVTNITSARGTLHCRKTRIPCEDQLVICGLHVNHEAVDKSYIIMLVSYNCNQNTRVYYLVKICSRVANYLSLFQ
jgi:hypothetical protein